MDVLGSSRVSIQRGMNEELWLQLARASGEIRGRKVREEEEEK